MRNPFHSHAPEPDPEIEPGCAFMRDLLNGLADGTATGLSRWYAERHVAGCPHCSAALTGLRNLRVRLRTFGLPDVPEDTLPDDTEPHLLSPERRAAILAAWEAHDSGDNKSL